jgi:hypothetical protein
MWRISEELTVDNTGEWPYSSANESLSSWIGHVHYDNGEVKEISVVTADGASKMDALARVCEAAGIASPNATGVRGVMLQVDAHDGTRTVFGSKLRAGVQKEASSSNVVDLRPTMSKYRVSVYPTGYSAYKIEQDIRAPSGIDALSGVLKMHSVDNIAKAGDYIVKRYLSDGSYMTVCRKGNMADNSRVQPEVSTSRALQPIAPDVPSAKEIMVREFRALLALERTTFIHPLSVLSKESS